VERLRQFLASPVRQAPTHNINNYWFEHRLTLAFQLERDGLWIFNDPNLDVRITARDEELARQHWRLPGALVSWCQRLSLAAHRRLAQFDHGVAVQRLRHRIGWGARGEALPDPLQRMRAAWPERTHLMWHASQLVGRFGPARRPWDVLEIGSGSAIFTAVLRTQWGGRYVNIDLPEQIAVGFSMLSEFLPEARVLLPHEVDEWGDEPFDVAFITPEQLSWVEGRKFDVAANMFSFGEMSADAVEEYFGLLRRLLRPDGIFYCANRIAKSNLNDGTIRKFDNYPWQSNDVVLHDRTDLSVIPGGSKDHRERVARLAAKSSSAVKLEREALVHG